MVCTFYHNPLGCTVSYCYYPKSPEIECPVKKEYLAEVGIIYRESPDSQSVTQQMQQRRYPKKY
jgi:hypothetical protein